MKNELKVCLLLILSFALLFFWLFHKPKSRTQAIEIGPPICVPSGSPLVIPADSISQRIPFDTNYSNPLFDDSWSPVIWCEFFDKNHNLWIGTHGKGLCKYDGKEFIYYKNIQGIKDTTINCILQDNQGRLWIGTAGGGLTCFDGKIFFTYTKDQGLSDNNIRCMLIDKNQHIWVATGYKGICCFDGKGFTKYTVNQGLCDDEILCMLNDGNNNFWFGSGRGTGDKYTGGELGGISRFDGKNFTNFHTADGLNSNAVSSIIEDKNGRLWFSAPPGLNCFDGKSFTSFNIGEGLCNDVFEMFIDNKGETWLRTMNGIFIYNGKYFRNFDCRFSHRIWAINEDANGNMWFGASNGELIRYDSKHYTFGVAKIF